MYPVVKRILDILFSLVVSIVILPIFIITAIAIKIDSPGSIIFKQRRLGKNGRPFEIWKFRSMCEGAEKDGHYSFAGDKRVTRVGKFIRATSVDEIPQIYHNILIKGDMSLIGFRPPLTYHPWPYEKYTEEQKKMFSVKPGITGWAQINGRKTITWEKRIEMGVWYAENMSLWLDTKIFFRTIIYIIKNKDNINTTVTVESVNFDEDILPQKEVAENAIETVLHNK